jgi:hypothetical protein
MTKSSLKTWLGIAYVVLGLIMFASAAFSQTNAVTGNTNVLTYSGAVTGQANAAAGDIYCIGASATKLVKIKGIRVSAIATTAIVSDVTINKRSTLDTGGTPTTVTIVPNFSVNPVSTATITTYGTAPTPGTLVGAIRSQKIPIPTTAGAISANPLLFQFSVYWDQALTLARGSTEAACVTVPAITGAQWDIDSEHSEE